MAFGGQVSTGGEGLSRTALMATGISLVCAGTSMTFALRIRRRWLPQAQRWSSAGEEAGSVQSAATEPAAPSGATPGDLRKSPTAGLAARGSPQASESSTAD